MSKELDDFVKEVKLALENGDYDPYETSTEDLKIAIGYIEELQEALKEERNKSLSGNWRLQK